MLRLSDHSSDRLFCLNCRTPIFYWDLLWKMKYNWYLSKINLIFFLSNYLKHRYIQVVHIESFPPANVIAKINVNTSFLSLTFMITDNWQGRSRWWWPLDGHCPTVRDPFHSDNCCHIVNIQLDGKVAGYWHKVPTICTLKQALN